MFFEKKWYGKHLSLFYIGVNSPLCEQCHVVREDWVRYEKSVPNKFSSKKPSLILARTIRSAAIRSLTIL